MPHDKIKWETEMGHGAVCSNKDCSHRLALHHCTRKKGELLCAASAAAPNTSKK